MDVRFENLTITAKVKVGSRALPTLVNYARDVIEVCYFFLLSVFLYSPISFLEALSINIFNKLLLMH